MFLLVSYDYCNSQTVTVHAITSHREQAEKMYHELEQEFATDSNNKTLLELVEFGDDYISKTGIALFWGIKGPGITISNNR